MKNSFFIANPNDCAQRRLEAAGIKCNQTLVDSAEETHTGAWVTQKAARKVFMSCALNGDIEHNQNHAFDLFEARVSGSVRIEDNAIRAALNVPQKQTPHFGVPLRQAFAPA